MFTKDAKTRRQANEKGSSSTCDAGCSASVSRHKTTWKPLARNGCATNSIHLDRRSDEFAQCVAMTMHVFFSCEVKEYASK